MDVGQARSRLQSRAEILSAGTTERALRHLLTSGEVSRVRTGYYVSSLGWAGLHAEDRHLIQVVAADAARRAGDVAFVGVSAAVVHRLPLFRVTPERVHVAGPRTDAVARPKAGLAHHGIVLPATDRTVVDGLPCTSLARTVVDLARTLPREAAVAAADAALRQVAWDARARRYDDDAAEGFRRELQIRVAQAAGGRGVRQARFVTAFADGRAQLPGESVSRLLLRDLGFAPPRLQVPFAGPNDEDWAIDFGLDDVRAWGEFDGKGKYTDPLFLAGRTPEQALLAEKQREDWIRGRSNRRFARWEMSHIASAATLGRRLASFHIHAPS